MMTKVCSEIMMMRQAYGRRRSKLQSQLARLSSLSSRRERARTCRLTSMRMVRIRLAGKLRREDKADNLRLNQVVKDCEEDMEDSLRCFREATMYLDDVALNPRLIRDTKYRLWTRALDFFLLEMKTTVNFSEKPGKYNLDIVELLISRLCAMRINEMVSEQIMVRLSLEDAMQSLFIFKGDQATRLRVAGR